MLRLFVVDGQGGQAVQFQPGGVPGNVLVVALRRDHCAVVAAEFQLRQIDLGPQLLGTIVHQLTRDLTDDQIQNDPSFAAYFVDHTTGIYPTAASGFPWTAASIGVKGAPICDLTEDMAAEQKARVTYDNILRLAKDDPDVTDVIRFLREREIVHFQRFGSAIQKVREMLDTKNVYYTNPAFDKYNK